MSGLSGAELDAAMLDLSELDGLPGIYAYVTSGNASSSNSVSLLSFISTAQAIGITESKAQTLLAFIATATAQGIGISSLQSLLAFQVQQISVEQVSNVDLNGWLQLTHLSNDLAELLIQIIAEARSIQIYEEQRVIQVQMDYGADSILNNITAITI